RDELAGLIVRRGPEQVVGIMAAVLAGAAYLPVDAGLPQERIQYMLQDGRVRRVLSNVGWQPEPGSQIEALELDAVLARGDDPPRPPAVGAAGWRDWQTQADADDL